MPTFKSLNSADIKSSRSFLNQLVDVVQADVSGSTTRRKHLCFITGGVGPGVTASLFQTVYDQNYQLQTANPVLDLAYGAFSGSAFIASASSGQDSAGKLLFQSNSLMMREKINVYRQYAQLLLGNANYQFPSPFTNIHPLSTKTTTPEYYQGIENALFISFKRLFSRDRIKRESFAMKIYQSASHDPVHGGFGKKNLDQTSTSGSIIITDVGSTTARETSLGGEVANLIVASDTNRNVGLIFYEKGTAILDLDKVMSGAQHASGAIAAMADFTTWLPGTRTESITKGTTIMGSTDAGPLCGNPRAKFIPDFVVSASMDNIIDHIASCRFQSGSFSAMTFQNVTDINSTLIFCRLGTNDFNYSSNPTYKTSLGRIRVIETGAEDQASFTMLTTVGLYNPNGVLLAVAKLSRPIEKNIEKEITLRVRLDF